MLTQPRVVARALVTALGFVAFAAALFSHGGVAKSRQFQVIGALLRGDHGARPRLVLVAGFLAMIAGACLLFGGVASRDRARNEACEARCRELGHPRSRIGPNSDRDESDRRTWWVACICEGGDGDPVELRADGLRP